jgi:5-methylcytosine-specific restriction protein A
LIHGRHPEHGQAELMSVSRIAHLPAPVTAAKADWLVASHWIGFTPASDAPGADGRCQAVIAKQFGNGYVLEYITRAIETPNPGFEADPEYLSQRAAHAEVAGRLVAIHRLRPTARPLRAILGDADFEHMQDMWAERGKRRRWSVAFPIVESYEISTKPYARDVFPPEAVQRLFAHPSATLRPLNDGERSGIMHLPLRFRATSNAWIAIEDEIAIAERSNIDTRIARLIEHDLKANAMEGISEERRAQIRRRAAWLAHKFVKARQAAGTLVCDKCPFDPATLIAGTAVRPRQLLDVHHLYPMAEGVRVTTVADFALLCPTCHRFEHALLRASSTQ